jgi:phage repressor protein C with HTH and peptisase S24 domain
METIRLLRKSLNLTQKGLAEKLGVTYETVQNWESGRVDVPMKRIKQIAETFGVSPDWLLTGNGEMFEEYSGIGSDSESDAGIPLYDHVFASAGYGIEIFDETPPIKNITNIYELFGIAAKNPDIAIIKVAGDSMSPNFISGDYILIDKKITTIVRECVYLLNYNGTLMIKSVQTIKNGYRLISFNAEYRPIELSEEDNVIVIGMVIGMYRTAV